MNKKIYIAIIAVIILVVLFGLSLFIYNINSLRKTNVSKLIPQRNTATTTPRVFSDTTTLKIKDFKVGTGAKVTANSKITFDFVGILTNGKVFTTTSGKEPITVTLGTTPMIKGWQEGLIGMQEGGQRRLVIPPQLGYGSTGLKGEVPPNATVIYDITLKKIVK